MEERKEFADPLGMYERCFFITDFVEITEQSYVITCLNDLGGA